MALGPGSRQRSSAAIVMTRADPPPAAPGNPPAPSAPPEADWQWLWWIPLGVLVAALWGLFLIGLRQPGAG